FHREDAIDWQSEHARRRIAIVDARHRFDDRAAHVVESFAGRAADGNDRFAFEKRSSDELFDLESHELEDVVIDEIAFRDRDETARDAEESTNREMFARL